MPVLRNAEKIKVLPNHVPCLEWGGFYGNDLKRAERVIQELGLTQVARKQQVNSIDANWVYIPPFKNKSLAEKAVKRLKKLGIDSFRVQESGKWNNAISLAILRDNNAAEQLLNSLKDKGFRTVKMGARPLQQTQFIIKEPKSGVYERIKAAADQISHSTLVTTVCKRM